jgi:hypothetical protein
MNLYKFRTLERLDYVLDIILNERLYCSFYKDLNDPFEGLFSSTIRLTPEDKLMYLKKFYVPLFLPPDKITVYHDIDNLIMAKVEHVKICSLSSSLLDVRLWSNYADGHRGIAIEIDFKDKEDDIHEVHYDKKLPHFDLSFFSQPKITEVLTHKTIHWAYEDEYRIINEHEYYDVSKRIKTVYCGLRISKTHLDILSKSIPKDIPIYMTKINNDKVVVEPSKEPIERST